MRGGEALIRSVSVILALAALLLSATAAARSKTDTLALYNGDRVTGEVKSLSHGILSYGTDSMGTLSVEWQDIATLSSGYFFEVRLSDGSRHFGSIGEGGRPGEFRLISDSEASSFEWLEVVEIRPIEKSWVDRLKVYLSTTLSYTRASSVAETNFNTEVNYSDTDALNTLTGRYTRSDNGTDSSVSSRLNFNRAVWTDRNEIFRAFWGTYETNDELGLDHRYAGGIGLGRFLVDTHRMRWQATAGLQLLTEKSLNRRVDDGDTSSNTDGEEQALEGVLASNYSAWRLDSPELDLSLSFQLFPNLSDFGRVRGDTNLRLRWEIIRDLFWDATAWGTYDSDAESGSQWDYGVSTGVGWEFN